MSCVAYDVIHVLGCRLVQKQDVSGVFGGEVCQHAHSCSREVSISVAILETNLLRGYGGIPNYVYYILSITCVLSLSNCVTYDVTCDRNSSLLFGPRFMSCVAERRWHPLFLSLAKGSLRSWVCRENCVTSAAYTSYIPCMFGVAMLCNRSTSFQPRSFSP